MIDRTRFLSTLLTLCQVAANIALAAVLSRALGLSGYGQYATLFSAIMIFAVIGQAGLPDIVLRETAKEGLHPDAFIAPQVWGSGDRLALTSLALAAAAGAVLLTGWGEAFQPILWCLLAAHLPAMALLALRAAALRGLGYPNLAHFLMSVFPFAISIGGTYCAWDILGTLSLEQTFTISLASLSSAAVASQAARGMISGRRACTGMMAAGRRAMRREAVPVAAIAGMAIFNAQVDVLMLGAISGSGSAAVYQVALQITVVLSMLKARLAQTVSRDIAALHASNRIVEIPVLLRPVTSLTVGFSIAFVLGAALFGEQLLTFGFGEGFSASWPVLLIIACAWTMVAPLGFPGQVLTMCGRQWDTMRVSAVCVGLNVVLNPIAIVAFGEIGAALTLLVSVVTWHVLLWRKVRKYLGLGLGMTRPLIQHVGN